MELCGTWEVFDSAPNLITWSVFKFFCLLFVRWLISFSFVLPPRKLANKQISKETKRKFTRHTSQIHYKNMGSYNVHMCMWVNNGALERSSTSLDVYISVSKCRGRSVYTFYIRAYLCIASS